MADEVVPLVLDIGSSVARGGFGSDDAPRAVFSTVVGRPKHRGVMVGMGRKDSYVGDEAFSKAGILGFLAMAYPVQHGAVANWDDFEKVLHQTFYNELRVAPEEHPLFMTESPAMQERGMRQKLTQIAFETFNVAALYLESSAVLSLLASGHTSGLVFESGEGITAATPVIKGRAIDVATQWAPCGGGDVTERLGKSISTNAMLSKRVKEKMCHVVQSVRTAADKSISYEMPDGTVATLGRELFMAPEVLFSYTTAPVDWSVVRLLLLGIADSASTLFRLPKDVLRLIVRLVNRRGWTDLIESALASCTAAQRALLGGSVVLSGANTLLRGAAQRLQHELPRVRVVADTGREHLAWRGGSLLSKRHDLEWKTAELYNEVGPQLLWEKHREQ